MIQTYVFMVDNSNVNLRTAKTLKILFHELCHQYGADDHYHEELNGSCINDDLCSDCNPGSRPKTCIMYSTGDNVEISSNTVLCDGCKADILAHLNTHHIYS